MLHKYSIVILFAIALVSCGKQPKTEIQAPFNYTMEGSGDTTLIFVHGLAINQTYWENQVDEFMDNYTVITLDLPGHGASKLMASPATVEGYANNIVEFVELLDLQNVVLIGHSMAGDVDLVAYEPLKEHVVGFIGVDNFQEIGTAMSDSAKVEIQKQLKDFQSHYKKNAADYALSLCSIETDSVVRQRVTHDFANADSLMVIELLQSIVNVSEKEGSYLKKLEVPLILIDSDMYPVNGKQLDENCGKGYKLWTIKGSGHFPMIEKPEQFNEAVRAALRYINSSKK